MHNLIYKSENQPEASERVKNIWVTTLIFQQPLPSMAVSNSSDIFEGGVSLARFDGFNADRKSCRW